MGDADRPGRLGRAGGGLAHRAPRGHPRGAPEETADVGEPAHVTGLMGLYTEIGVVNRRRRRPGRDHQRDPRRGDRAAHRAARRPADRRDPRSPSRSSAACRWDWRTLLRNRPLDVWMHEQDVRRAVGRPGGMDSPAARHTAEYLAETLGLRARQEGLARRPARPPCSRSRAARRSPSQSATRVGASGCRRHRTTPTVRLRMDRESFIRLAGGRRAARARTRSGSRATRSSGSGSSTHWRPPRDRPRRLGPRRHPGPGPAARSS